MNIVNTLGNTPTPRHHARLKIIQFLQKIDISVPNRLEEDDNDLLAIMNGPIQRKLKRRVNKLNDSDVASILALFEEIKKSPKKHHFSLLGELKIELADNVTKNISDIIAGVRRSFVTVIMPEIGSNYNCKNPKHRILKDYFGY